MSATAEQLKLVGMSRAAAAHPDSLKAAQFIAELLGRIQPTVSINDVRKHVHNLNQASGSVFSTSKWEAVGWVQTEHTEGHARYVRNWRLIR